LKRQWEFYDQFSDSLAGPPPPFFLGAVISLSLIAILILFIYFAFKKQIRLKTEELTVLNETFETILDTIPQRIFWKDKNLIFRGTNRSFREDLGIESKDEIEGKPDTEGFGDRESSELDRKILENGKSYVEDWVRMGEAENPRFFRVKRLPLFDRGGRVNGVLGCYEDRTEEWHIREQFRSLSEELAEKNSRIQELGITDPLSELYNYRYLQQRLAEEAALFSRHNQTFSIILIDIENLSRINKELGYAAGDSAIAAAARSLREFFPSVDIIGRLSGGRFLIILPHTSTEDAGKAAEMVCDLVQKRQDTESQPSLSLYCVVCGYEGQGVDEIRSSAEDRMREAKLRAETGRVFFA
jgi:diguanylate cyclase (GGDEF)-like protein